MTLKIIHPLLLSKSVHEIVPQIQLSLSSVDGELRQFVPDEVGEVVGEGVRE